MTSLKDTTWQMPLSEKEQRLRNIYNQQQQRAHQVAQRGSAGSNGSSGSESNAISQQTAKDTANSAYAKSNMHGGKVRQMFDERRQTVKGIDRSYPLEPLVNHAKKRNVNAARKSNLKTRQIASRPTESRSSSDKTGTTLVKHEDVASETFGPKLIHYEEDLDELYNENYVKPSSDWQTQIPDRSKVVVDSDRAGKKIGHISTKIPKKSKKIIRSDPTNFGQIPGKVRPTAAFTVIKSAADVAMEHQKVPRPDTSNQKVVGKSAKPKRGNSGGNVAMNLKQSEDKISEFIVESDELVVSPIIERTNNSPSTKESSSAGNKSVPLRKQSSKMSSARGSPVSPTTNLNIDENSTMGKDLETTKLMKAPPTPSKSPMNVNDETGDATTPDSVVSCKVCGRKFTFDRIARHTEICSKTTKKKRKVFNASTHRTAGTEMEPFVKKPLKRKPAEKITAKAEVKPSWRRKHEDFINAIRSAKQVQAHLAAGGKLSDLPPPPPSDTSDYIQCPHCGRKFNQSAADRHIPKCQNMLHNKPNPRIPTKSKR